MTAQINDVISFEGYVYQISEIDGDNFFSPESLGIFPVSTFTACWRGYMAQFKVENERLYLDALDINVSRPKQQTEQQPPAIAGKNPADRPPGRTISAFFEYSYIDLQMPVDFTGTIIAGDGFIMDLYVHMGFQAAWKYTRSYELKFERGALTAARDISSALEQIRDLLIKGGLRAETDSTIELLKLFDMEIRGRN